ncbi:MAG TPA: sulfur transferase domain-containing protein [Chthoniobacterales bacterium]
MAIVKEGNQFFKTIEAFCSKALCIPVSRTHAQDRTGFMGAGAGKLKFRMTGGGSRLGFNVMRKAISQQVSVGEQPRQSDLEELKRDGVTTVVNLRMPGEASPLTPDEEHALAEKLDLEYYHVPVLSTTLMQTRSERYGEFSRTARDRLSCIVERAKRACSFSLAASGVDTDSIFEKARELGFPVQDEKLMAFLKSFQD